ncbi:MAG: 50S ribosomal protein L18e [Candidatus Nanohaloarchaea archaeon]
MVGGRKVFLSGACRQKLAAARCIIMDKKADPTNPVLVETLEVLKEQEAPVWKTVREHLGKVNRQRPEVNISDIERVAEDGETVVVPGKVLGSGRLTKEVEVAAFKASRGAKQKIGEEGEFMFIQDLVEENPEGEEVRIVK